MSATAAPPDDPQAEEADRLYFRLIEERFVVLRDAAVLLGPADWQLAARWRRQGVPIETVRAGLESCFERYRARGGRGRISSLRYCRAAVEDLWAEEQELLAPGLAGPRRTAPIDVVSRLAALAAALPELLPDRAARAGELLALSNSAEEVEKELAKLESRWLAEEAARLFPATAQELARGVEQALAPLRERFAVAELVEARARLERQLLRRHLRLFELSLFSPAALPPVSDTDEPASSV